MRSKATDHRRIRNRCRSVDIRIHARNQCAAHARVFALRSLVGRYEAVGFMSACSDNLAAGFRAGNARASSGAFDDRDLARRGRRCRRAGSCRSNACECSRSWRACRCFALRACRECKCSGHRRWRFALPVRAAREFASQSDRGQVHPANDFACAPAIFENRSAWRGSANFFRDFQFAQRSADSCPAKSPIANFEVETG